MDIDLGNNTTTIFSVYYWSSAGEKAISDQCDTSPTDMYGAEPLCM
jgi:hypothetical protein